MKLARSARAFPLPENAEPEFTVTDGFVATIRRRPESAYEKVTGEVTGEVQKLLAIMTAPMTRTEMQNALGLKSQANFRDLYLKPALDQTWIKMTIPDKPTSSRQRYRLTAKGQTVLDELKSEGGK